LGIFPSKGTVCEGSDADLVLVDKDFNLEYVIARGQIMVQNKEIIVKGTYE
jgi:beta-aspartyl-dipeptidase (metallo-type)